MAATIVEKWRQMLSSFADIKAAIEEKGGIVSGGYNTYANGVRGIYSDTVNPVTAYPAKTGDIGIDISAQITFCAAVKEEIRQAIIDGGVDCDSSVPLSVYGDKIRGISGVPAALKFVTNARLPSAIAFTPYEAAIEVSGGKKPYTFTAAKPSKLPPGLAFSADGVLSGTPTTGGVSYGNIAVAVTDAEGKTISRTFRLSISTKQLTFTMTSAYIVKYDGQPHYADIVCNEVPDVTFNVVYKCNGEVVTDPTETGQYRIQITDLPKGYDAKSINPNSFWIN